MRRVAPFVLAFLALALSVDSIELSAPLRCGGSRVVPHATANFGRQLPSNISPELIPAFAPRPAHSPRQAHRRWGLFRWLRLDGGVHTLDLAELCDPIEPTLAQQNFRGKVVFALRGRCDFARKALLAESAGGIAVVVVNGRKSGLLVNMKLNGTAVPDRVSIPTVMISFANWAGIAPCRELLSVALTSDGRLQCRSS